MDSISMEQQQCQAALPPLETAHIPRATYRLQFNAGFRLSDAQAALPYLATLGVSHLYASPLLKARPGSLHGYDVIDPTQLNPEIGDEAAFDALHRSMRDSAMHLLLDIVPNHMGVLEADNPWWLDVLENGPAAEHANAFDIEWQPPQHELRGQVLLAVLGQPYGVVLEAGEIVPVFEPARGQFVLHYYGHRFPLDPAHHAELLDLAPLPEAASHEQRAQIESLRAGFERLPDRNTEDSVERATRQREVASLKQALARIHAEWAWAPAWLEACAAQLTGQPGNSASFDRLDALLQRQAYRLAFWRAAGDEINYRRFFDINGLAALRAEDPAVFEASHKLVLGWLRSGRIAGLRIDHPDGMADPEAYFRRLQQAASDGGRAAYIVVEKILGEDEAWPREWPVHGDTGYRFANQVNGLFVDPANEAAFDEAYAAGLDEPVSFDIELDAAKRAVMGVSLAADLRQLTELAHDIGLRQRHTRDLTRPGLKAAIIEYVAAFDVYRSYVSERGVGPLDRARIEKAAALARTRCRPSQLRYLDFVRQLLLQPFEADPGLAACQRRFVQRLQQFTAPVMAKAMEDTAFYRYHRLVSLNDVGGDPRRFGMPVAAFHAANLARKRDMPHTLLGSSTHDSKRSEDVRTRLDVLSEMPQRWQQTVQRWREMARTQWRIGGLEATLTPNDEILLFQTLLGVWPLALADDQALAVLRERVAAYMLKAVREAKQVSSWLDGNDDYEGTLQRCVELLLARLEPNPFLTDLRRLAFEVAPFGCVNSLALVACKLTAPGVPDLYQGCEDWMFALVDPDNRRPVDFASLRDKLGVVARLVDAGRAAPALRRMHLPSGLHKLLITWRLLQWRVQAEALFRDGEYFPLETVGEKAEHVVAFARHDGQGHCSVTVVPRLGYTASGGDIDALLDGRCWGDTQVLLPQALAGRVWEDVVADRNVTMAGDRLPLDGLLQQLPVAVLRGSPATGV
ncbi:MAG TPA: malto-oligosyltrehalose synthase [Rubrivivax sp.]|nr:malto-oligosyltrehalose synthase [Rubrivivax sp.]